MSSQQQSMNQFVQNPKTGRLIKIGSKTHKKLVASKLLDEPISTPQENIILEADDKEQAKELQGKINKTTQKNKVITRRGNKVLKANRRPTRKETIDKVSTLASDVVIEHRDELLEQDMTDDECENYIRNLIMLKLSGHDTAPVQKEYTPPPSPNRITTRRARFELDD